MRFQVVHFIAVLVIASAGSAYGGDIQIVSNRGSGTGMKYGGNAGSFAPIVSPDGRFIAFGGGNAESGPWDPIYGHITKDSEFVNPSPGETFVNLDENADSINDPGFFPPHSSSWVDVPASDHNGGGMFSFGDGHVEVHQWTGSLLKAGGVKVVPSGAFAVPTGDPDVHWVSSHTQRLSERSY